MAPGLNPGHVNRYLQGVIFAYQKGKCLMAAAPLGVTNDRAIATGNPGR
jgi:hypothetical protein